MGMKVVGGEDLPRKLQAIGEQLEKRAGRAVFEGAKKVRASAKEKSKGSVSRSIGIQKEDDMTYKVGTNYHVARFVEKGHGGPHPAPPHPFLRPAFDENKDEIKSDIKKSQRL